MSARGSRRTGLGRSLALTLPLSLLGALGVAVLGWWMAGRGTPLEALRSFRFYEALWPALCGNVRAAVTLPGRFSPTELALGALAVLTLPELLHGLCRGRDLRCAMILLLLVSAAALWALSGQSGKIQENVALLVGMVLYTGLNYFGQRFFAFRKKNS